MDEKLTPAQEAEQEHILANGDVNDCYNFEEYYNYIDRNEKELASTRKERIEKDLKELNI